ncbi:hypothetical protein Tco_0839987 [Tanacetum coccineum]|uniref:Uncharacterized protein n=1 Tax=Tanacetum coccineum TaxID=301880 RepID=A0ABQ5AS77_9ASTR
MDSAVMLFGLVLLGVLSSAALAVLTTRPACQPSLASCLSSLGESLPSVPDAYGQSLEALLSPPAASGSEAHVPGVVSKEEYPVTVAVSDEHRAETRVHIPTHGKHRPPPLQSVWSPDRLSYPP